MVRKRRCAAGAISPATPSTATLDFLRQSLVSPPCRRRLLPASGIRWIPWGHRPNGPDPSSPAVLVAFAAGSARWSPGSAWGRSPRPGSPAGRAAPDRLRMILNRIVGEGVRPPGSSICSKAPHPVAVGLIRPSIVLPARFAEVEPEGRIEAAPLAHEWAHIRNGDLRLLAVSRLLLPLLFAHPLYAGLRRRMPATRRRWPTPRPPAPVRGGSPTPKPSSTWSRAEGPAPNTFAPSLGLWGRARRSPGGSPCSSIATSASSRPVRDPGAWASAGSPRR